MNIIQVDMIRLQILQALLDTLPNKVTVVSGSKCAVLIKGDSELGAEKDLMTLSRSGEPSADELFRVPVNDRTG